MMRRDMAARQKDIDARTMIRHVARDGVESVMRAARYITIRHDSIAGSRDGIVLSFDNAMPRQQLFSCRRLLSFMRLTLRWIARDVENVEMEARICRRLL